jgi:replicative DNA helicase
MVLLRLRIARMITGGCRVNKPFKPSWAAAEALPALPHSLEAERALLGALICFEDAFTRLADSLRVEDFYEPAHFHLFATMSRMAARGGKMNIVTLVAIPNFDGDEPETGL